jgi:hypothetical protein
MYVYYGTNEYNFEKLEKPPKFEPARCAKCKKVINLGYDGYSMYMGKYYCMKCSATMQWLLSVFRRTKVLPQYMAVR